MVLDCLSEKLSLNSLLKQWNAFWKKMRNYFKNKMALFCFESGLFKIHSYIIDLSKTLFCWGEAITTVSIIF